MAYIVSNTLRKIKNNHSGINFIADFILPCEKLQNDYNEFYMLPSQLGRIKHLLLTL